MESIDHFKEGLRSIKPRSRLQPPFWKFPSTLPEEDLKPNPLCEWKQLSAFSLHRPRSRRIQYLAYLRDQNLALWGRWRGRGTRRDRGCGAAVCWPNDTPAPGCEMGCHAQSGWSTTRQYKIKNSEQKFVFIKHIDTVTSVVGNVNKETNRLKA